MAAAADAEPKAAPAGVVEGSTSRRELYPDIEPYNSGMLKVTELHTIYYEESGNKEGKPVVFVHGGPGGGVSPINRRFFNPEKYRIILFDQRGCGKSTPHASLEENTTWTAVEDMESVREHLGIDKWVVFGGSWGSTLSLSYAVKHADRVLALILRGIFMLRKCELGWFYEGEGAQFIYPDAWESYVSSIPGVKSGEMMAAYSKLLTSDDEATRMKAAQTWSVWEGATSKLQVDADFVNKYKGDAFAVAFARIENHFFTNEGFFERDGWLLEKAQVDKIRDIPAVIVQGRYDIVCPMKTAWELHTAWPEAKFQLIKDAGHNANEPGIQAALLDACDEYAD